MSGTSVIVTSGVCQHFNLGCMPWKGGCVRQQIEVGHFFGAHFTWIKSTLSAGDTIAHVAESVAYVMAINPILY